MIRSQTRIPISESNRTAGGDGVASRSHAAAGSDGTQVVRAYFSAIQARDRAAMERLLGDDFTFTSPFDDRIGKAAWFERCWPNGQQFRAFEIETLCGTGAEAFVRYECAIETGPKFRNLEYFRIEDGRIREVEVYFGSLPEEGA